MADEVFDMAKVVVSSRKMRLPLQVNPGGKVLLIVRKKAWVPNWLWRLVAEEVER